MLLNELEKSMISIADDWKAIRLWIWIEIEFSNLETMNEYKNEVWS